MRKPTNKTGRLTAELPRAALPPFVEGKVGKAGGTSMLRAKARIRRRRLSLVIAVAFLALLLGAA